jgi:ABC-2 type transport system permease protein
MNLWRLEWLRLTRTRRLIALIGAYAFFGFVGPLTARYLSAIIDRFGGGEIQVVVPDPVPVDGIVQFTGNIYPIGLLVAVVVAAGALTPGALPEMAIFLRTRVNSATRLVIPRFTVAFAAAAAAYVVGVGIAWYETAVLLGALPAGGLLIGALFGILYLGFAVAVAAAIGSSLESVLGTVMGSLLVLLVLPIAGIADAVGRWLPSHLVGAQVDLVMGGSVGDYLGSALITVILIGLLLTTAVHRVGAGEL